MTYRWYDFPKKEVLSLLHTDEEKGLERKEAAERLKEDGKNVINPVVKAPIRGYLLQVVYDLTALLMLAAAVLAFAFRRDAMALAMLVILAINYAVTVVSYIRAQKTLEKMGYRAQPTAKAVRSGKVTVVDGENVVQGDILLLSAGDIVPCDCRILESEDLFVLEGNLFGTVRATKKDASFERIGRLKSEDALNLLYASTVVYSGRCRAVAVETGPDTLVCKLKKNKPIAACHRLKVIADLKKIGSWLSALLIAPVFLLSLTELVRGGDVIGTFLASLALAVSAMPELYAAFAYVAVARGVKKALEEKPSERMIAKAGEKRGGAVNRFETAPKQGVFIKNPLSLPAVRDLNCLFVPIESMYLEDRAALVEIFDGDRMVELTEEEPDESALRVLRYGLVSTGLYTAARLIGLNNRAENVYTHEQEALIAAGEKYSLYNKSLEDRYPILDHRDAGQSGSLFENTLVHYMDQDVSVLRGAPEEVLSRCTGYVRKGRIYEMDAYARTELLGIAQSLVKESRTPVAVATKSNNYNSLMRIVDAQTDLIFEGFLSIEKPLLPGVAKQILRLREAGVKVLAYSSSQSEEQLIRARALGIVASENAAVRSTDLVSMDETVFRIHLKNYTFFMGFSAAQLRFTVDALREEYGMNVGMVGRKLEDVYPMYGASVGISEEQGRQLGRTVKGGEELHAPVYQRKSRDERGGCQALNYISDVILPQAREDGSGGLNAAASAICASRFIYRNIAITLIYLFFSVAMRLTALFISAGPSVMLEPLQYLLLGPVFDLFAVFVICFDTPEGRFVGIYGKDPLGKTLLKLLPAVALGGISAAVTSILSGVLMKGGLLAPGAVTAFSFTQLLLLQLTCLTALLRTGRARKEVYISPLYGWYLAALFAFLLLCFLIRPVGAFFMKELPGAAALAFTCVYPVFLGAAFALTRLFVERVSDKKRTHGKGFAKEKEI